MSISATIAITFLKFLRYQAPARKKFNAANVKAAMSIRLFLQGVSGSAQGRRRLLLPHLVAAENPGFPELLDSRVPGELSTGLFPALFLKNHRLFHSF